VPNIDHVYSNLGRDSVKKAEIILAAGVAVHLSISSIDHMSEIVKGHGEKSVWIDINLHRTKCSMIVKNDIAASLKEDLRKAIRGRKFSLMIDKSTNVSTQKILADYQIF
jgi:hypothetical protein